MGCIYSIICAVLGGFILGPVGAFIGFFLGAIFAPEPEVSYSDDFVRYLFILSARIAKADGVIAPQEAEVARSFMRFLGITRSRHLCSLARDSFNNSTRLNITLQEAAENLMTTPEMRSNPNMVFLIFDMLVKVTAADGVFVKEEEDALKVVAAVFNISAFQYKAILTRHFSNYSGRAGGGGAGYTRKDSAGSESVKCFDVLNCTPDSPVSEIKKNYRKLVAKYHPDKLQGKGLPDDMIKYAEERFKEIQNAYEEVKRIRSF